MFNYFCKRQSFDVLLPSLSRAENISRQMSPLQAILTGCQFGEQNNASEMSTLHRKTLL